MASKAELAKEESKKKKDFYTRVLNEVFGVTSECMRDSQKTIDFKVKFKGRNRYIGYSVYGAKINILLYTRGQVVIQMKEACHMDFEEQLFEYDSDQQKQDEFIEYLQELLKWLIPIITDHGIVDMHTFMDYIEHFENLDMAYEKVLEDWSKEETI